MNLDALERAGCAKERDLATNPKTTPKWQRGRPLEYPFDRHGLDATPLQIARAILRREKPRPRQRRKDRK